MGPFAKKLGRSCCKRRILKDVSNSSCGLCPWYRQNTYLEKMRKTSNSQDRRTSAQSLIPERFFDERVASTELWVSGSQYHRLPVNRESLRYKWMHCIFKARCLYSNRGNEKNNEQPQSVVPVCGRNLFRELSCKTTIPCIWFNRPNIVRPDVLSAFYEHSSLLRRSLVTGSRWFEGQSWLLLQGYGGQELRSFETLVNTSQSTRSHILEDLNSG